MNYNGLILHFTLSERLKNRQKWKVDNFKDKYLRIKTESNDKNRLNAYCSYIFFRMKI